MFFISGLSVTSYFDDVFFNTYDTIVHECSFVVVYPYLGGGILSGVT
jgi:hypothetical protein